MFVNWRNVCELKKCLWIEKMFINWRNVDELKKHLYNMPLLVWYACEWLPLSYWLVVNKTCSHVPLMYYTHMMLKVNGWYITKMKGKKTLEAREMMRYLVNSQSELVLLLPYDKHYLCISTKSISSELFNEWPPAWHR